MEKELEEILDTVMDKEWRQRTASTLAELKEPSIPRLITPLQLVYVCRGQQDMTLTRIAAWLRMRGHEDLAEEADGFAEDAFRARKEVGYDEPNMTEDALLYDATYTELRNQQLQEKTVSTEAAAIVASDTPMFVIIDGDGEARDRIRKVEY